MSANSKIEWTDHTFNPWIGCTKVSPACDHCYAEVSRPSRTLGVVWGPKAERRRTTPGNWAQPLRWDAMAAAGHFAQCAGSGRRGDARTWEADIRRKHPQALTCCPDRKLVPARPRVFCASLADVFDNEVPVQWRRDLFDLIEATPNLDWLLLTKRIGNARNLYGEAYLDSARPWPQHVWLGATICNQEEADRDIPKLLRVPTRVRFLSMEPLLGPVHMADNWLYGAGTSEPPLDWVIVGGESGPHARPMHPDWARSLRDQCQDAGVPFHFKQWGEHAPNWLNDDAGQKIPGSEWIDRMGKKAAGRLLDGRTWDEVPA